MTGTIEEWIDHDPDPATATELRRCSPDELADRFSTTLTFGTAGLRGPVRGGPNGMNVAVVLRATHALAIVARQYFPDPETAVIVGGDARHGSRAFVRATGEVLAAHGFRVVMFDEPVPTPLVAFSVRQEPGARFGVQITASHNPAADNGYKVYWSGDERSDGAQIVGPVDAVVEEQITTAPFADAVPRTAVAPTPAHPYVLRYLTALPRVSHPAAFPIAITAMHGVGAALADQALRQSGFPEVQWVAAQREPDPDFPTAPFPNPEEPGATDLLLALGEQIDAKVLIALDPDADRCAVGIRSTGGYRMLSGDETGLLLGAYLLRDAPADAVFASTIVSSDALSAMVTARGFTHERTLTGFKWLVRSAGASLRYAYEEAIGHCVNPTVVRDKDGISTAVVVCDVVAWLAQSGRSVQDYLDELAAEIGIYATRGLSVRVSDAAAVVARLSGGTALGDAQEFTTTAAGHPGRVIIRASGTEPKVKAYLQAHLPVSQRELTETALTELSDYALGLLGER